MQDVLTELALWKERGDRIALATVIDVQRSAPRPPGAKMAVNSRGEIDVWVQAYEPGRFEEVARSGGRAAEVTMLEGAAPGAKLLVLADGARSGSLGSPELDDEAARVADELLWAETSERR